jgi:hypothetical protein
VKERNVKMNRLIKITVMALLFSVSFFGCSKVNRENYDKIKAGMNYQQVISIIGEPDKCDAALGVKTCVWGNETKHIAITFMGDKVFVPSMKGL